MLINLKSNVVLKLTKVYLLNQRDCEIVDKTFNKFYTQKKIRFIF